MVCEDNGWVNNGDGTYSNPEGIVVSLEDTANCCCEYKFDCANNLVTPDNYTDTAFIDSCGYCVGTGTENLDTILDTRRISSDQYVCGVNPSGGANVECTANWANTGCGCWHEEHSPGVINPRYVYTDNQSENAPETWPEGFEGQLAWYYNSDNDGYGCYLSYEGCSLGLYPEGSIIPYTEATCLSEGGVWDTMTGHTIKWQDFDATFQNELSFAYENGTSVRVYINGTFHDVPFGLCVNEYIQDGEIKSCFDEQSEDCNCDDVINFESTEEGRRANCSSHVYSYHKSDWHYCYEAPQNYIAPVCVIDNPIYWPAWMSNDNYDCGGPYWIGFEYDDTYAESHPLYPDMGDPCACTGSGSEDDFDAPYSGVDQVITDENAYATPGYYDCLPRLVELQDSIVVCLPRK